MCICSYIAICTHTSIYIYMYIVVWEVLFCLGGIVPSARSYCDVSLPDTSQTMILYKSGILNPGNETENKQWTPIHSTLSVVGSPDTQL